MSNTNTAQYTTVLRIEGVACDTSEAAVTRASQSVAIPRLKHC